MPNESRENDEKVEVFIKRWSEAEASERANYQMFLTELCDILGLVHPDPSTSDNFHNRYVFDRAIGRQKMEGGSTTVYADLYKHGCFILETKQGSNAKKDNPGQTLLIDEGRSQRSGHGIRGTAQWDVALEKAYNQARQYIRDLPAEEGRPPFLIVCDVGYVIELYSEFTCTGGTYVRYPDPQSHRIYLEDLRKPEIRERLVKVWTAPLSLDPSKYAAQVTREVAEHLARLAKSLEADGHQAKQIATFLQRCLFTMFAEDVGLLPDGCFTSLLKEFKEQPDGLPVMLEGLWKDMASGKDWSAVLRKKIAFFNGGLFENPSSLPLNSQQIALLIGAAKLDWSDVEPAIFGTLLERALSPSERHKLGAHYTPRSYVERLVKPTIIDPLRDRWDAVKTAVVQWQESGKSKGAIEAVKQYHHYLCSIKVLDPACGSGNFLYVTLEHMKRLEGEVLELLKSLGDTELTFEMEAFKVRPQQFLGLEINERAVAIAQLVLWIGYFQWHKKTTGNADTQDRPLLPKQRTIVCQDAVLAYDRVEMRLDADGQPVTIWDGRTTKPHPVTQREVPDESATIPVYDYINPRRAEWPEADFIVGNPPFIGKLKMRDFLGDGYINALRSVWNGKVPNSADYVMYWWHKAAEMNKEEKCKRFGLITTNSIHQSFNRRVVEQNLSSGLSILYAIADHPWVDSSDGAAVRISMTVGSCDDRMGVLERVVSEKMTKNGEVSVDLISSIGKIASNLKLGADLTSVASLESNSGISCLGLILGGKGFKIERGFAEQLNSKGKNQIAFPIWNGNDITGSWSDIYAIDAFGLSENQLQTDFPEAWQHLKDTVFPVRQTNRDEKLRKNWWLFRRANTEFRNSTSNLSRFIVTPETAKHRFFTFLCGDNKPEHRLVVVSQEDSLFLSILSSNVHIIWALAVGGRLEDRPVYNKTRCFETFPFPDLPESTPLKQRIRELGEQLDAHRKRQQAAHPKLTMTGMYNVLETLRRGVALSDKEHEVHELGLVTLLKQIHDDLDAAVLEAYGWSDLQHAGAKPLADRLAQGDEELEQAILGRLVALNHERAAEEKRGLVRWLRPEYQNPEGKTAEAQGDQGELQVSTKATAKGEKLSWPKSLPEQVAAIRQLIADTGADASEIAGCFGKRTKKRVGEVEQILETLRSLGQLV